MLLNKKSLITAVAGILIAVVGAEAAEGEKLSRLQGTARVSRTRDVVGAAEVNPTYVAGHEPWRRPLTTTPVRRGLVNLVQKLPEGHTRRACEVQSALFHEPLQRRI